MPVWRCPHCATPQPESSRCWVCRRSTTSCATCRHFRRGVAGGLGLCGLDPRRRGLDGTEILACWVAAPAPVENAVRATTATPGSPSAGDAWPAGAAGRRPRTFVPVESLTAVASGPSDARHQAPGLPPLPAETPRRIPGRWWLWGDPEPWPERFR